MSTDLPFRPVPLLGGDRHLCFVTKEPSGAAATPSLPPQAPSVLSWATRLLCKSLGTLEPSLNLRNLEANTAPQPVSGDICIEHLLAHPGLGYREVLSQLRRVYEGLLIHEDLLLEGTVHLEYTVVPLCAATQADML